MKTKTSADNNERVAIINDLFFALASLVFVVEKRCPKNILEMMRPQIVRAEDAITRAEVIR